MIRHLLTRQPHWDSTAVIQGNMAIPYGDLNQKAISLQSLLPHQRQGTVAIFLPNSGDYIAAFWGTVQGGMIAFPLNVMMTKHELAPLLRQASVHHVITSRRYKALFDDLVNSEDLELSIIVMEELGGAASPQGPAEGDIGKDLPMIRLSTSGTTGTSKIVQLSENNVTASLLGYLEKMRFHVYTQAIRFVLAAPFSSVYGLMILSACLTHSFPIVILDPPFTLDALFRATETYGITHYEGSASPILLMEQLAGRPIPYDIHTLTYMGFGGSKVSSSTVEKVQEAYPGVKLFQGYGMTETAPLIAKHPRTRVDKTDSVGTAIKGMDIAIASEGTITHAPYTRGEIVVKGPNVMLGYYQDEAQTQRVLKEGYLYTGDMGYLDEGGYLYICGRKKAVIIVRGFTVYPEEVEACIQNSGLAKDCCVYGATDGQGNESICADLVPLHPGIDENAIRRYCNAHLAAYKQPHSVALCQVIKRNASGKVERR